MWKAGLTEEGLGALGSTLGVEAAGGQVELMVAEMAIFGIVLAARKIKHNVQEKKTAKAAQQQAAENKAEQDRQDAENARLAELARQQEIARQNEELRLQQEAAAAEQYRQAEQLKVDNAVRNVQNGMAMVENDREIRIRELEIEHNLDNQPGAIYEIQDDDAMDQRREQNRLGQNGHGQWQYPYNPNVPIPGPNNGGNPGPNNGGNPGPNGGGNNPQRNIFNYNTNPYYDLISSIAAAIQTQKNNEQEKKDAENKDNPVIIDPTDPTKKSTSDEILDNQHLIQQEIEASLGALGESELTQEEILVQLESIEKMIDDQIPDQVKLDPYSVFSSDVVGFNQL